MSKRLVTSDALPAPTGHFSQVVVAQPGELVFVSGMTARNASSQMVGVGDIAAQTHQVCRNLRAAVEAAGGSMDDIVRIDVFVRDMDDFSIVRSIREQYFTGPAPTSTMVEVARMANQDALIEVSAIAVIGHHA